MPAPTGQPAVTEPLDLPSSVEVVVIGAGLAGLACARRLHRGDADGTRPSVVVLEAAQRVGGRIGTELVDGYRCDRGFQVLNPAYPEARRVLDLQALALQPLPGAVVVATESGPRVLGDPRRTPPALLPRVLRDAARSLGGPAEKLAFARWALGCARRRPAELLSPADQPWSQTLTEAGVDGELRRAVLEPFLSGTLAEMDGSTSRRFVELLIRSFVRGRPSVPWSGMQAIGDQLAAQIPAIRLGVEVQRLEAGSGAHRVATAAGTITARAVVVATDPATAARFTGQDEVPTRPLTTFWHTTDVPDGPDGKDGADGTGGAGSTEGAGSGLGRFGATGAIHLDGERRTPLANSVVLSASARAYAPYGKALIATTIRGLASADPTEATSEPGVRRELARIYGADTTAWELVRLHEIPRALTVMAPPLDVRRPVDLGGGLFVAGDHRDTASIQGALVSGRRAADAVFAHLGMTAPRRERIGEG